MISPTFFFFIEIIHILVYSVPYSLWNTQVHQNEFNYNIKFKLDTPTRM